MKKEIKQNKIKKIFLSEVMEKYGAVFSIELSDGFAHINLHNGEFFVK